MCVCQVSGFNNQKDGGVIHGDNKLERGNRFCKRMVNSVADIINVSPLWDIQKWSHPKKAIRHTGPKLRKEIRVEDLR